MENIALVIIKMPWPRPHQPSTSSQPDPTTLSPTSNPPDRTSDRHTPTPTSNIVAKTATLPEHTLAVKFISAGLAACFADIVTFPLDTAKVRLQIQGEGSVGGAVAQLKYRGMSGTLVTISKEEGVRALYNGLVPGLQRQMAFASIRIGLYDSVKASYIDLFQARDSVGANNVGLRILAGITTGAAAVSCAQPTDVVKVRMQAQGTGPKRYTGCMNAYRTIAVQEGMKGLWKGTLPNVTRNAIVNAAEMVSYDLIKEAILKHRLMSDNMPCHFVSAFGAGFCTTVVASPVDVVKTRYMNSGSGQYKGAMDCAIGMYRERGLFTFYKGFMPSFMRLGSWNIVMFVTYEQLKRAISQVGTNQDSTHTISEVSLPAKAEKYI